MVQVTTIERSQLHNGLATDRDLGRSYRVACRWTRDDPGSHRIHDRKDYMEHRESITSPDVTESHDSVCVQEG